MENAFPFHEMQRIAKQAKKPNHLMHTSEQWGLQLPEPLFQLLPLLQE